MFSNNIALRFPLPCLCWSPHYCASRAMLSHAGSQWAVL